MSLSGVLVFVGFTLLLRLLARGRALLWAALAASILSLYLLQPVLPVRRLDAWLPLLSCLLTLLVWAAVTPRTALQPARDLPAAGLLLLLPLTLTLAQQYLNLAPRFGGFSLPAPLLPLSLLAVLAAAALLAAGVFALPERRRSLAWGGLLLLLLLLFVVLKYPGLSQWASAWLRVWNGQSPAGASPLDLRWLGYSYLAFRLIHVLRDRQAGRQHAASLAEFAVYVLFFPALLAGPIDRLERFLRDLSSPLPLDPAGYFEAGSRLAGGLFRKFVLADLLSRAALNTATAADASGPWLWGMVYAYAFMIYFDFSGYTSLAIGMGRLLGVRLPENFAAPYLKPNLTLFWNSWHITLTQWFRAYFFNPVLRWLRHPGRGIPPQAAMLLTQTATMLLIGLWHGITWNFALWGLWHGLGIFVQNRWSAWFDRRLAGRPLSPALQSGLRLLSPLLTFHYIALGWVWFALPTPQLSLQVLGHLFGLAGGG